MPRTAALATVVVLAAAAMVACGPSPVTTPSGIEEDDAITVGSFNFAESTLLGELYAQALERAGFRVRRAFDLGSRELVEPALERGLVEVVPEYAGSLLTFLTAQTASADPDRVHDALAEALGGRGLSALDPAPAQDRNVVVVTRATADRWRLTTLSGLAAVDDRFAFGGPPECRERPLCLPGLESVYGLSFSRFVALDEGGPVTAAALAGGQVQAALMFSSDGAIHANDFVALRDDRNLQPAENVTPVVRTSTLERFGPGVASALDAVSAKLTTGALRLLNEEVSAGGRPVPEVASAWLSANGFSGGVG